jgi:hypothetical protein
MKEPSMKTIAIVAVVIIAFSSVPLSKGQDQTQNYTVSFLLQNHPGGDLTYELNVTIPQALYQYYLSEGHSMFSEEDFAKFVTPYTLKPIADRLWQIYNNTEDFANGVLMIVHQLTYEETLPEKYPVETMVAGKGDCDLFAFIAASILEAGGINVVLFYYKTQLHMNIGVELSNTPNDTRTDVYYIEYQNVSYYTAECTGEEWRDGWRVGECPTEYRNASAQVITLNNMEQSSIGQVSASLRELDPSTLTLQISPIISLENSQITLSGQILPMVANQNVTLQAKINSSTWTTIGTVETQSDGRFKYDWIPETGGIIAVQASWLGNREYNGSTSAETNIIILPLFVVAEIVAILLAVGIVTFAFLKTRHKPQGQEEDSIKQDAQINQTSSS